MRINTSKSEAMVLSRKPVDCPLRVMSKSSPQGKEFKYLGVLFMSEGTMKQEIGQRFGAGGAVLRLLYRTVVTEIELSQKAISIFLPSPYL